ncbi:hypothetical protein GGG16DRAFT_119427 [Schizophyllum commune]
MAESGRSDRFALTATVDNNSNDRQATSRPADAHRTARKVASTYREADAGVLQQLSKYYSAYIQAHRVDASMTDLPYHAKFPPAEVFFGGAIPEAPAP